MKTLIGIYLLVMTLLTFLVYGVDKRRAIKKRYRIPESSLIWLTILGGGLGAFLAGHLFHHKTRKWYFQLTWYVGIILDAGLLYLMWRI